MTAFDRFVNRVDAGRQLGAALAEFGLVEPIVLALPRGGVPVGYEVAVVLDAPMTVLVARKIGAPGHVEFGIGAIAEGGIRVADAATLQMLRIDEAEFEQLADAEQTELERRVATYRRGRALPPMRGHDVLIVDDGLATGVTAEAALLAARRLEPERIVLAVPVCAPDTAQRLEAVADAVVCVVRPDDFVAVGRWYQTFNQTSDREVVELLKRAPTPSLGE
jgi:putative phosphoribosyl transferase